MSDHLTSQRAPMKLKNVVTVNTVNHCQFAEVEAGRWYHGQDLGV